jgi:G:T/U-mismatch repair DNA glycosylase
MEGEKVKAAHLFNEKAEKRNEIEDFLTEENRTKLWDGMRKVVRQNSGTDEAYKALSDRQKKAADVLQNTDLMRRIARSDEPAKELLRKSREAISALSEDEREGLRSALPDRTERVFEKAKSGIEKDKSQSEDQDQSKGTDQSQDQDQSQDRDRGRSRGRGMGF